MKILVLTDLEGACGVCQFVQTREDGPRYDEARRLLMGDINACVDGLLEAGVDEIAVLDGHGKPYNFVPEMMHPRATHLVGSWPDRNSPFERCDAVVLLAYHAMAETPDGVLCHSQSSRAGNRYWYNGRESGEITQHALIAGHFGAPVIMVTGDQATCREAREVLGDGPVTVAVKTGLGREGAILLAPEAGRKLIRQGARDAVARLPQCTPYQIALPIKGRLSFPSKEVADGYRPRRATRVDDLAFEATFDNPAEVIGF